MTAPNMPTLIAAGLSTLTLAVHLFAGGPEVHQSLQSAGLSPMLAAFAAVLWHVASVLIAVGAGTLTIAAYKPQFRPGVLIVMAVQYAGFAALLLFYGLTRLGTPWPMPQWTVFVILTGLCIWGLRGAAKPATPV